MEQALTRLSRPNPGPAAPRTLRQSLGIDGGFTYVPNAGFSGIDVFTYRLTDSQGLASNVATVRIGVTPPAAVPLAPWTPLVLALLRGAAAAGSYLRRGVRRS